MILNQSQPLMEHLVEHEDVYVISTGETTFSVGYNYEGNILEYQCVPLGEKKIKVHLHYPSIKFKYNISSDVKTYYVEDSSTLIEEGIIQYRGQLMKNISLYFAYAFDKTLDDNLNISYSRGNVYFEDPVEGPLLDGVFVVTNESMAGGGHDQMFATLTVYFDFFVHEIKVQLEFPLPDGEKHVWHYDTNPFKANYPQVIDPVVAEVNEWGAKEF